ncbi:MAG: hypothetical protein D6798_01550 [Deltaproteobacteria bacterium]|nr:MAG: hypothetical protein D6798_01550 [Deltaproteobacteria bacterium]
MPEPTIPPLGDLAPDAESAEVVGALIDSVDRLGAGLDARAIDAAHALPEGLLSRLAELGLFGLSLPEEHGGFGFSLWECASVTAALARHDRSVATTVGLHLGLGTRGLVAFGSPEQHARWVPPLASGEMIAAFAATEPGAGSDLGAIATRAVETDGMFRVDGSKIFVTNGGLAGLFTIAASTPGLGGARRGQGLLLLHVDDPGVEVGAEEVKLGLRGSSTTSLSLDGVVVPRDRLLGEPGKGAAHLSHVLAWGRSLMAAGCCGTGHAALDAMQRHCASRVQFHRPIEKLPVVAAQLADARALLFSMEALVRHTAADPEALPTRSLAAKVHCSEGAWELADRAVQLHGGSGYIEETGVALLLRDARITRIFEGANDVLRVHMGLLATMGVPRQDLAPLGSLGLAADALAAEVDRVAADLKRRKGARLGGAHVELHALGSLVALVSSVDAAVLRAAHEQTSEARNLAVRWLDQATARCLAPLRALSPDRVGIQSVPTELHP